MSGVILALGTRDEDALLPELIGAGYEIAARVLTRPELVHALEASGAHWALLAAGARLDGEVVRCADAHGVRLIVFVSSEAERRQAEGLGIRDVLDTATPWPAVERALSEPASAAPSGNAPGGPRGQTIAVWGPTGAPGRTTVAISIAAELAAAAHRVLLVDADSYSGAIAPALGLLDEAPGFAAACRLAGADALTPAELDRLSQHCALAAGSLRVLTGLGGSSRWPELSADRVTATLAACAEHADFVVVDTGFCIESDEEISSDLFAPRRNAATLAALRAADTVVAVGLADPVGISRLLRGYAELAEAVPHVTPRLLVNRVRASAIGFDPFGQVNQVLERFGGVRADALIPDDPVALDAALLSARTLVDAAPRSRARTALSRFVHTALAPAEVRARPRRRRGRSPARAARALS